MKKLIYILCVLLLGTAFVPCKKNRIKVISYTRAVVHAGIRGGMNGTIFKVRILNMHNGLSVDSLHLTYGYAIPLHLDSDKIDLNGNPIADADTLEFFGVVSDLQMADFTRNPLLEANTKHAGNVDEIGFWTRDGVHHWQVLPPAKISAPINMP